MDPIVRKRLTTKVKVYPFIKVAMGDRIYGLPYELSGYIIYKQTFVPTVNGSGLESTTQFYFEGHVPSEEPTIKYKVVDGCKEPFTLGSLLNEHGLDESCVQECFDGFKTGDELNGKFLLTSGREVQISNVKIEDDIEYNGMRIPVKGTRSYQGLKKSFHLVEVML